MSEHADLGDTKPLIPTLIPIRQPPPPGPLQDQLQAQILRRQVGIGFKHIIGQCRIAFKYSVVGWTGTIDKVGAYLLTT